MIEMLLETSKEASYVVSGWMVIQDLIDESLKAMIIDNRQDAERTVVEFIGRNIAGEVSKHLIEIIQLNSTVSTKT